MYTLFIILIVFAALLMVGIVLIQESKGGGLASNFASYNQIGGVRKTTDFIEKATWGLAAFMVIMSIACSYVLPSAKTSAPAILNGIEAPAANPNNVPTFGASPAQQEEAAAPAQEAAPAKEAE